MKNALLQAAPVSGSDMGAIIMFFIALAVIIILFIVLRNFILWYYKLDKIARCQEEQTATLKAILRRMESWNDNKDKSDSQI